MVTTQCMIKDWLNDAVCNGADFLIIACDTFDWDDYPVPASRLGFWAKYNHLNSSNMQKVMEVYDLSMNLQSQLNERRAMHCPPRECTA